MTSFQYRKSHCGDKTNLRPSYLHNGISYTGKIVGNPIVKIRRSYDLLISTMEIPILVRWHLYIESEPWFQQQKDGCQQCAYGFHFMMSISEMWFVIRVSWNILSPSTSLNDFLWINSLVPGKFELNLGMLFSNRFHLLMVEASLVKLP